MPLPEELLALWQRAKLARLGISVPTDDRDLLRQQLYRFRSEHTTEDFKDIIIVFPKNNEKVLFMTRRNVETIAKEMQDG